MLKTKIVLVLDESSSMVYWKSETIKSFNNFIEQQKKIVSDVANVSLIKFNSNSIVIKYNIPIENFPNLTTSDYSPDGKTALYDAISKAIHLGEVLKENKDRVIVVIFTDGQENASVKINKEKLKKKVSKRELSEDWTFLYIGEDPKQFTKDFGLCVTDGIAFDHKEPSKNFEKANEALSNYRSSNNMKGRNLFDVL